MWTAPSPWCNFTTIRTANPKFHTTKLYRKAGVDDVALLTRWAIETGLDEPLTPERAEDLPTQPKVHKGGSR